MVHCSRILSSFCRRRAPGARISWAVAAVEGPCRSNVPFPFDQDLTLRRSTVGTPTHRFPKRPSSLRERPFHLLPHFRRILLLQEPTSRKTCKVYNLLLTLTRIHSVAVFRLNAKTGNAYRDKDVPNKHLHLGVSTDWQVSRRNNNWIDPAPFLNGTINVDKNHPYSGGTIDNIKCD